VSNQDIADIVSERLNLRWMSPRFIEASLAGRLDEAATAIGASLPEWWPDDEARRRLIMRRKQMRRDPRAAEWLLRAMVRRDGDAVVGIINFHGPPDGRNRAELGYTVFETYRRQGHASEAAVAIMRWARTERGVETFVVSISPENQPSLRLAEKLGFVRTGSHIDDEDGEEWEFELTAKDLPAR
jgi:RimJ/RimL family protein N-acetyltransferase